MGEIFNITMDSNNLSEFDSHTGVITSVAALMGSSVAGMSIAITSSADRYGAIAFTQLTGANFRTRYYVDPNTLTMASNDSFVCLLIRQSSTIVGEVRLAYIASAYTVQTRWKEDSTSFKDGPSATISDAAHYIEVRWQRAANASSNDGVVQLYVDGVSQGSISTFDVSTIAQPDNVRFGAADGIDGGTSGTLYLDELVIRDDDTEIGEANPTPTPPAGGGEFPPVNGIASETHADNTRLIPSYHQSKGFSVSVFDPKVQGQNFLYSDAHEIIQNDSYTSRASGGFWDGRFNVVAKHKDVADEWLDKGLGRHIEVWSPDMERMWEGFVNSIEVAIDGESFSIGPLLGMLNKGRLWYSAFVRLDNGQGSTGVRLSTDYAENTDSQLEYGIIERALSGGGIPSSNAENLRDLQLTESAYPNTSRRGELTNSPGEGLLISVSLLGYVHFLKAYTYTNATKGTQTISAKIEAVLAADPNSIFSTDYVNIETNSVIVDTYEDGSNSAFDIIFGDLSGYGNASDERLLMGVYEDQKFHYQSLPSSVAYQVERIGSEEAFFTPSGEIVHPWGVNVGEWVRTNHIIASEVNSLRQNVQTELLETATFKPPNNLAWEGGKYGRLPQALGRLGLSGIGA